MGKLSSAIVQRKLAPLRDVEEALAHQVLYGSDLATNLLEQSPTMDEGALTALLAETLDLAPAPAREIPRSPDDTLHLVPGDVALRHGLYPLERQGQTLVVAVCDRLRADVEQDLAFGLGVKLEQRAAPLVRIRQAIGRDYGLPVDRRSRRVLAKLEGKPDPSPSVAPSPLASAPEISALPRPPSMPPIGLPASADLTPLLLSPPLALGSSLLRGAPATGLRALAAALPAPSIGYPEAPRDEESIHDRITAPPPPVAAADTSHLEGTRQPEPAAPPAPSLPPTPEQPAVLPEPEPPSTVRGSDGPAAAVASAPAEAEPPPRSLSGQHVISGMERTAWTQGSRAARPRARSRHRGPYTAADAEQDLLEAEDRDDILSALFDFASQYFEYSALFVVHGDLAEGRDSSGPGADRAAIAGIGVPLDLPSSLATVRTEGRFSVAPLGKTGMDARLAVDLNRKAGRKVLLLPVLVRGRSVVILYGDDGAEDVDLSSRDDIIAFAPLVAAALENLILRKKAAVRKVAEGDAKRPQSLQPVLPRRAPLPSRGDRAEALSQALQSTVREATLDEPPKRPSTKPAIPAVRVGSVKPPLPSKRSPTPSQGTPNNAAARARDSLAPNARAHDAHVHEETAPIPLSRRLATAKPEEPPEEGWSQAGSNQEDRSLDRSAPSLHTGDGPEISVGIADMEDWSPDPEPNAFPAHLQIVAPAQLPHKRHSSAEVRLPKVILNINDDLETLVRKIAEGDERAIERIADMGAAAASILVARLPGPLQTDAERLPTTEPASHRGPFLKALVRIGPPAIPFLAVRTNDTDPKIRALATHLLGELPSIEAAQAVARRITDGNAEVRRAALEAGRLLQSDEEARTTLRDRISSLAEDEAASMEKRVAALEALAHFRDPRTVPRVIRLVSRNDEIGQSAQWALGVVTRQAFGRDAAAWETWWQKNQSRHRIEWLIDALMHDEIDVRRAAGEELKALTKEYFGYYDDLAKAERAKSQTRYREWWESTGKGRFAE